MSTEPDSDPDISVGLAFVILADYDPPKQEAIIAAASEMGITLEYSPPDDSDEGDDESKTGIDTFEIAGGGTLFVMMMPVPHPDVSEMSRGPLSPEDMDALIQGPAHCIVTATGLEGDVDEIDIKMAALTASVLAGCNPVGVLKMPGVIFHRPDLFADLAKAAIADEELPYLICVDVTAALEDDTHMSFLTHNMQRYGREEFYVVTPTESRGAFDYLMSLMAWMLEDREYHLPTGDTLGRTADEKILIQRVPNPIGEGPEVIRLDLP